ncbi:MAG: hypothetical protein FJ086_05715, partial [Deltaproteobacteria bacterium]|nr:hypothetical protein [Deltaproteobacteria bacterium]
MTHPRHDLARILALAREMAQPGISAQALAASCGPVVDPLGRGEQLDVSPPGINGVHSVTVLPEQGMGGLGSPRVVMLAFAVGNRPRLGEVRALFGQGQEVAPLDWEPLRVVFDGPTSEHAAVEIIPSTDDAPGG